MDNSIVMIVEDDKNMRFALNECIKDRFKTVMAVNGQEALELYQQYRPDLILLDIKIPVLDGLQVLEGIKKLNSDAYVIMLTGHATVNIAVEAMKLGAYDFITKPFEVDELICLVEQAVEKSQIAQENWRIRNTPVSDNNIIYYSKTSQRSRELDEMISNIAASDYTILLEGESGTGKTLIAREIHNQSSRKDGPFVLVDCASLPNHLIESELFGFEKGAFTGAASRRIGKIERANGGTVFLDEISTLNLNAQANLLSVIQNREFERLGGDSPQSVDVRIIAASNQNLKQMVKDRNFRHDLYYRLNVFTIQLIPLRERKEDIIPLAYFFIKKFGNRKDIVLSTEAAMKLKFYEWPGNIRELENAIKHALILIKDKNIIESNHFPLDFNQGYWAFRDTNQGLTEVMEKTERMMIEQALLENDFNVEKCARALKISKRTLYYRISKLEIDLSSNR